MSSIDQAPYRSSPLRLGIAGLSGRKGQSLLHLGVEAADIQVAGGIVRHSDKSNASSDKHLLMTSDLDELLPIVDVLVDVASPSAVELHSAKASSFAVPYVCGVTGLSDDHFAALKCAANAIPLVYAANFSIGVALLMDLVSQAAAALPTWDIEVVELHHRGKKDAPSGTASALVDSISSARESQTLNIAHGRVGSTSRSTGELGVHSLRAGGNPGEHRVLFATEREELALEHRALSRSTFAAGALAAAHWVVDQPPGLYRMADVIRGKL